jgi:hypothetical protein
VSKVWSVQIGGWLRYGGVLDVDVHELRDELKAHPGCEVVVTIEPAEARRSNQANRYLFGVVYPVIAEYTGQPKEDIHDEMCVRFTTETISYLNKHTGEMVEMKVVRRTSGMTVSQFHAFVERVKLFSQEFFGLTFEEPSDDYRKEGERASAREQKRRDVA